MAKYAKKPLKVFFICLGIMSFAHILGLSTGLYYLDIGLCGGFSAALVDWV